MICQAGQLTIKVPPEKRAKSAENVNPGIAGVRFGKKRPELDRKS